MQLAQELSAEAQVASLVRQIESGQEFSRDTKMSGMDILELYECWDPLFKLLGAQISDPRRRSIEDYTRLARVQFLYIEDVFSAAETCAQAVAQMKLTYRQYLEEIYPRVFEHEDYKAEATILQAMTDQFAEKNDRISALERLCLLYEKKVFNEAFLSQTYTRLLEIDPFNIKALRYFKLLYSQTYEWEKVSATLRSLLRASKHPRDLFRVGQELAGVLLYQLDQPTQALQVMREYCEGSPLDSSTINFDSYQRLGNWEGCLRVLRECLLNIESEYQRAVVHFRMAKIAVKLSQFKEAKESFEKTIAINPQFWEAYEGLFNILTTEGQWNTVRQLILQMIDRLPPTMQSPLSEVLTKLNAGLSQNVAHRHT